MTDANEALRALEQAFQRLDAVDGLYDWSDEYNLIRAHLSDPGYVRVPVEPSHELIVAGWFGGRIEYAMGRQEAIEEAYKNYARLLTAATKETSHD